MRISNQIKMYMILFALTMQFCLQGMTKQQAVGLTLCAGAVSAAFISHHTDDPKAVAVAFVLPAAIVYQCAKRYTPGYILGQVRSIIKPVSKDIFALSYEESFASVEDEEFIKIIGDSPSYQENITEKIYPVIIARDKLVDYQKPLSIAEELLIYAKGNAQRDSVLNDLWIELDDARGKYSKNMGMAVGRITRLPSYELMDAASTASQKTRKQLVIAQQDADTNTKNAKTKEEKVKLKEKEVNTGQQNANSFRSFVNLEWIKWFFSWFSFRTKQ